MKVALGIHIGHDRCVCLIKDGKVIADLAQERLDRIKHSQSMSIPYETIDALLQYCDLKITDISCIGLSHVAIEGDAVTDLYKKDFFDHYQCPYVPFYFVRHHNAHAYAVYFSSGFQDSLVLVADGGGDFTNGKQESETMYIAQNGIITVVSRRLQNIAVRHMKDPINHLLPFMPDYVQNLEMSLARKYSQVTHLLGFKSGEEGKTMGLASYGKPVMDFTNLDFKDLNFSLTYGDIIREIFALQNLSGKSFQDFLDDRKADIASTVQNYVEKALISIVKAFLLKYPVKNICFSGGIFLNCLTNHKICEQCNVDRVFILPASGDDGQALGSAYFAYVQQYGWKQTFDISLPYLGLSYTEQSIAETIKSKNLKFEKYDDVSLAKQIAFYINENKIIALHRGRTEIGPRALCHRSILANPSNPDMKDILNQRVKHREEFRPFAPTVTSEEQFKYFNLKCSSEYMLLAATVKEEYRSYLSSITHIDGTARIQSVSKEQEPFIHLLLEEVKKLTGFPVLLNTSFNVAGQPIVESPLDAVNTFLTTNIDILVIGNYIINKETMI